MSKKQMAYKKKPQLKKKHKLLPKLSCRIKEHVQLIQNLCYYNGHLDEVGTDLKMIFGSCLTLGNLILSSYVISHF